MGLNSGSATYNQHGLTKSCITSDLQFLPIEKRGHNTYSTALLEGLTDVRKVLNSCHVIVLDKQCNSDDDDDGDGDVNNNKIISLTFGKSESVL